MKYFTEQEKDEMLKKEFDFDQNRIHEKYKDIIIQLEQLYARDQIIRMKKFVCTICGYIYDPEVGDPDSGISPGTPFERLPDNWLCPECGADKSAFEEVE